MGRTVRQGYDIGKTIRLALPVGRGGQARWPVPGRSCPYGRFRDRVVDGRRPPARVPGREVAGDPGRGNGVRATARTVAAITADMRAKPAEKVAACAARPSAREPSPVPAS